MKNKGMTVIELLGSIVILAVVALIIIPVVTNVITKSKLKALQNSAYGLVDAANLYYSMNQNAVMERFDSENNTLKNLSYKGSIKDGTVIIDKKGKVTVCINDGKNSAYKNYNEEKVTASANKNCNIPNSSYIVYLAGESTLDEYDNVKLTELVNELSAKVSALETENTELKTRVTELETSDSEMATTMSTLATKSEVQQINANLSSQISTVNSTLTNQYNTLNTKITGAHTWTDVTSAAVTITDVSSSSIRVYTNGFECIIVGEYRPNTPQSLNGGWGASLSNISIKDPYRPKVTANLSGFDDANRHIDTGYLLGTNGSFSMYSGSSVNSISRIPIYGRWPI